ncbi:hypothetical protein HUG17_9572 [Dermatophagoides farinae]|uniref:Uncharacterized protein n=1 Tax=Dermatophagoides farinae TaxID=6954 RepID=A0A9D4P184_DERFA|nr:hypothetical protein HUG17_9572 [Dermatophagoides farinae]
MIKCGCDYLNNTIGISITENNQIYQMLYTNQTLQVIKYEQQINGKRISTVNNKPNSYRMNLIDGHYYYHLNQLIQSPDVYKKLLDLFKLGIDDKSTQQQISRLGATIMIDDDHKFLQFYCYKTFDHIRYFVVISNDDHLLFISYRMNEDSIRVNKYGNDSLKLLVRLHYMDHNGLDYLYSAQTRSHYWSNEQTNRMKQNIHRSFQPVEYGFIINKGDGPPPPPPPNNAAILNDEKIVFLLSNSRQTILSFNFNAFYTDKMTFPITIQSYQDFFYCESQPPPPPPPPTKGNDDDDDCEDDENPYKNDKNNNNYQLNLIDGQLMTNGIDDIINDHTNVVKKLIGIFQTDERIEKKMIKIINDDDHDDHLNQTIMSISMSINDNGNIRIYCLKTYNGYRYLIGDYGQEIDSDNVKIFFGEYIHRPNVMGTVSVGNNGIIIYFYNQKSFSLNIAKLTTKHYGVSGIYDWTKILYIDPENHQKFIVFNGFASRSKQQHNYEFNHHLLNNSVFTFGFVDRISGHSGGGGGDHDVERIFLFSNQNEKILSFSTHILVNKNGKNPKVSYRIQSYQDFFKCQHHDDNDNNNNGNEIVDIDDYYDVDGGVTFTDVVMTTTTTTTTTNTTIELNTGKTKLNTATTTGSYYGGFIGRRLLLKILIIIAIILILGPLMIIILIACYRNWKFCYLHSKLSQRIRRLSQRKSWRMYPIYQYQQNLSSSSSSSTSKTKTPPQSFLHSLSLKLRSDLKLKKQPNPAPPPPPSSQSITELSILL